MVDNLNVGLRDYANVDSYAVGAGKLVVSLVDPAVAKDPALMGMLNGQEHILFDKANAEPGLLTLAQWAQSQVHREQQTILQQQLQRVQAIASQEADARQRAERQLEVQVSEVIQLQSTNQALTVLLVFVLVVGGIAIIANQ